MPLIFRRRSRWHAIPAQLQTYCRAGSGAVDGGVEESRANVGAIPGVGAILSEAGPPREGGGAQFDGQTRGPVRSRGGPVPSDGIRAPQVS